MFFLYFRLKKTMKKFILAAITLLVLTNCSSGEGEDSIDDNSDYIFYMSGKINESSFFYGAKKIFSDNEYTLSNSGGTTHACLNNPETGGVNYYSGINTNDDNFDRVIGMWFVKFYLCSERDDSWQADVFNDKFPVGSYPVATDNSSSYGTPQSIAFEYSLDGKLYTTNGDQTGSYVTITKSTENNTLFDANTILMALQIVEGEYSVKLYNESDSSDVITITNGKFKMRPSFSNF